MTIENIQAWTQLVVALAALVGPVCGLILAKWRREEKRDKLARGENVDDDPPSVGMAPMGLVLLGGALLAYLYGQHPELALHILPSADSQELAAAAPTAAKSCTSSSDCRSGCQCTSGQCTPCSARKPVQPPPQKHQPRIVATLNGEICADCLVLPQMLTAISQPFGR